MQLSRRADYGVRAMIDVASRRQGKRTTIDDISRRQAVPVGFLRRIIAALAVGGLLQTQRGEGGGIILARQADDITLLEILEALEGPIALNRCTFNPSQCPRTSHCAVHEVWARLQRQLTETMGAISLSALAERQRLIDDASKIAPG
ncbi:MAG: Rrf2 family transcriptional regulator [Chloroflexi bacterium]|nr:Rrf2 family transcriptional regulator [Chloroflexota bacterium]